MSKTALSTGSNVNGSLKWEVFVAPGIPTAASDLPPGPIEDRDAIARAIAQSPRRAKARTTKLKGDINMRAVHLTAFGNPVESYH